MDKPSLFPVNTIIKKDFGGKYYRGVIVEVWTSEESQSCEYFYHVYFPEDGDEEDISHDALVNDKKIKILSSNKYNTLRKNNLLTNEKQEFPSLSKELEVLFDVTKKKLSKIASLPVIQAAELRKPTTITAIANFFLFCNERQLVWSRRKRQKQQSRDKTTPPTPLSTIPKLRDYKFCNIYRELDRGTQYFRSQALLIVQRNGQSKKTTDDDATTSLWERTVWSSILYRLVNKVDTFANYGGIPPIQDANKFLSYMKREKSRGITVFTGQHQTCSLDTLRQTCKELPRKLTNIVMGLRSATSLRECWDVLRTAVRGVGGFVAWQILCDLLETRLLFDGVFDEDSWCELGPGAKKGLDVIFGDEPGFRAPSTQDRLAMAILLRKIQDDAFDALDVNFPYFDNQRLTLKNIEHALCEFKKFVAESSKLGLMKSRSYLNKTDCCAGCEKAFQSGKDVMRFCDICGKSYCHVCTGFNGTDVSKDEEATGWLCQTCNAVRHGVPLITSDS